MHTFEIKHNVAHSADDMFALVARVEHYPKFLPLCEEMRIKRREQLDGKEILIASMVVGYKLIRESMTTKVTLDRANHAILVEYLDGPFAFLENRWRFQPRGPDACEIDFYISYSFRSRLFENLVGGLFARAVERYTAAFEARADAVYGTDLSLKPLSAAV
jgi:coenzyme Q-binding protein COQ10